MLKTALIVLDFINGINQRDDFKGFLEKHHTLEKANQLIADARKKQELIVFVKVGFSDSYVELAYRSPIFKHNKPNHWLKLSESSTDFDSKLDYRKSDIVLIKHRINAFYGTPLEAILSVNQIEQLILCGISTNYAVESTARDAHDRNYAVTIAKDACASNNEENQEKSLSILSTMAEVKTVAEIIQ